ncbi:transketolase-like TK C-terminal-containing protein [Rosettibacter primus]|uniref:transketolase-like TK C-terminal-containing protein n=1 Tax=Rosettibacter primus TaxID=3111523 RepID=UPI003EBBC254
MNLCKSCIISVICEVPVAVEAKKILSNDLSIRVVSIPSKELFEKQSDEYKKSLFPNNVPVVIIEAASMTGWGEHKNLV